MRRRQFTTLAAGLPLAGAAATTLRLRWMFSSGEQRSQWLRVASAYPAPAGLVVESRELEQADYKQGFEAQLRERPAPDVMFWFAGQRLREAVAQGLVAPLDELAAADRWSERFHPAALDAVRVAGRLYALPLSTYAWGLYYRRSLFERLALRPPQDWTQWLRLNDALREAKVAPLTVGAADAWTLGAWFDYLNLRMHGKAFHQALLAGQASWRDARVTEVLRRFQQLWLRGDFQAGCAQLGWRQVLPYLSRGRVGMVLMGGFVALQFPAAVRSDIGFCPFPQLRAGQPRVENAPLDVLLMPAACAQPQAARDFLRHMAQAPVQAALNQGMGLLAPQRAVDPGSEPLQREAAALLAHAQASMQYFDRDSPAAFSAPALALLQDFVRAPGQALAPLQSALEALRRG